MKFTRKQIWQHNSFFGFCRMDLAHMRMIKESETARPQAKQIANDIELKLKVLMLELKKRVDQ